MVTLRYRKSKFRIFGLLSVAIFLTVVYLRQKVSVVREEESIKKLQEKHTTTSHFSSTSSTQAVINLHDSNRVYTLPEMRTQAGKLNFLQVIKNREYFGNHSVDNPVIVIQVHDRVNVLKLVFNALKMVKGIENATLVLSRDYFSQEMDFLIDSYLDFCRYIEIYFPFSMQLYPDKFPGSDPNDCPRDLPKNTAIEKGCNNADFPDMYGHYREVKYVQIKHHWFWKLNMVFTGIKSFKNQQAPILFMEDDHFVAPDILYMLNKATELKEKECMDCDIITLGGYDAEIDYNANEQAIIVPWESVRHNMGMILSKKFYVTLTEKAEEFCSYDDYNWDWSLQYVGSQLFQRSIKTLYLKMAHVVHLGCSGFHNPNSNCVIPSVFEKYKVEYERRTNYLFPKNLKIVSTNLGKKVPGKPNGGWGDIRDHSLCKSYKSLCQDISAS